MLYREAIAQATVDALSRDDKALVLGVGVADVKGIFGTTLTACKAYPGRVIETPLSENMLTGACVGLALEGYHPMFVHARMDFLLLTMEHIVNTAAKWRFSHGSNKPLGMAIRCIIGRGWGQGPQHSQALHALFGHIPGVQVLLPFTGSGAYHAIRQAFESAIPTIVVEHRRLYETESGLDADFGGDGIIRPGTDVTLVGTSAALLDCIAAADLLARNGISAQVYAIKRLPIDQNALILAVSSTRSVVAVDIGAAPFGLSAEVLAICAEADALSDREGASRAVRVIPPFYPCGTSAALEAAWYPTPADIVRAAYTAMGRDVPVVPESSPMPADSAFRGPF